MKPHLLARSYLLAAALLTLSACGTLLDAQPDELLLAQSGTNTDPNLCAAGSPQGGKGGITVRHVLTHQSGLFNVRDLIDDARRLLDWDYMVKALAAAAPTIIPPGATAYQALTYGFLVGELIRRVSGRTVAQVLAEEQS